MAVIESFYLLNRCITIIYIFFDRHYKRINGEEIAGQHACFATPTEIGQLGPTPPEGGASSVILRLRRYPRMHPA